MEVVSGDVCNASLLHHLFEAHRITHVVHLAAQAGVRFSQTHPMTYVKENLECFTVLLEVLRAHAGVHLVYASSSSVYGTNREIPFRESDRTDHPANL